MAGILSSLNSKGTHSSSSGGYNPLQSIVPLRDAPDQPDNRDSARIAAYLRDYNRQTDTLLVADRQIEYNVRMLCNQQWSFWNWEAGQFMDVADWFTAEEQRWRQLPTVNEELRWFVNTHSRLTENPPILTWLPGPDKTDADLAECLDTLVKLDWRRAGMSTLHPEIMMWVVLAGRGHAVSRLDLTKGDWRPWVGNAPIPMVDGQLQPLRGPDGQPMMTQQPVPDVPIKYDGTPNAVLAPNGQVVVIGKGHMERTGGVACDVLSPLQVRGEWGPQLWHQKRWHAIQRFLTPEQVFEQYHIEVEPDVNTEGAANVAILERVLYGAGFYGTSRGLVGGSGYPGADVKGPLCTVFERWDAPLAFDPKLVGTWAEPMMETPDEPGNGPLAAPTRGNPGGRHIVFTPKTVISDGPREVRWPHTSPVRCWDFIRLPGRPRGTTSLESLHSPQRTVNKLTQLLQDSTSLNGAPQRVVYSGFGIQPGDVDNAPNRIYLSTGTPADGPPIAFLNPPQLSPDTYRVLGIMMDNLDRLGGTKGTTGAPPSEDPSGVAVQELRFNADRDLGDTARRAAEEYARQAEDWRALYPLIYTLPQVIAAGGEENTARTIVVWPELFAEGNVRVQADAESMLPEGRGERQARAERLWQLGAFGDPRDPAQWAQATDNFLELSRFPNYSRMARPGGIDRVTAEEENGQFLLGVPGQPVLPWYDDAVHLKVHYDFMKSREFLKQPPQVQQAMQFHTMQHEMNQQKKQIAAAAAQAAQMRAAGIDPATQAGGGGGHPPPHGGHPGGNHRHVGKGGNAKQPPGPGNTESRPTGVQPPAHNPKSRGGANGQAPLAPV